ncbi:MAG: SUMF1/EgtB/PvdO family nonheme iron enzyme [Myxococcales bacterium]|nr:SUMF1/EgtB/PvdO family nonheme iron enzyme [Myxococcales bacterium]
MIVAIVGILGITAVVAGLWWVFSDRPTPPPEPPTPPPDHPIVETTAPITPTTVGTVLVQIPKLTAVPATNPFAHPLWAWGAAVLFLAGAGIAAVLIRRRPLIPPPSAPPPTGRRGPVPLPPTTAPEGWLLRRGEQDDLVWGIAQHTTGEPTDRLDLDRTVAATAKNAGIPVLIHEQRVLLRGVWLWVDITLDDPVASRWVTEVMATLARGGLECERAYFDGIPDRLWHDDGSQWRLSDIEERLRGCRIAIVTDGRRLVDEDRSALGQHRLDPLFSELKHWPTVLWALPDQTVSGLRPLLAAREMAAVGLTQAAIELANAKPRPGAAATADTRLWLALCALFPGALGQADVLALKNRLGLSADAWDWHGLRAAAGGVGSPSRLGFAPRERGAWLHWLEQNSGYTQENSDQFDPARLPARLSQALGYFRERLMEENSPQALKAGWDQSMEKAQRQVDRALVDLWDRPETAVEVLYDLYRRGLSDRITQELARAVGAEATAGGDGFRLPWKTEHVSPQARYALTQMGFRTGEFAADALKRAGRVWLGLGLMAGAALVALAAQWIDLAPVPEVVQASGADTPEFVDAACNRVYLDGTYRCTASGPGAGAEVDVTENERAELTWETVAKPKDERWESQGAAYRVLRRDPTLPRPWVVAPIPAASQVQLEADPDDAEAVELARALIESGNADVVVLSTAETALMDVLGRWPTPNNGGQRLVLWVDSDRPGERVPLFDLDAEPNLAWLGVTGWAEVVQVLCADGEQDVQEILALVLVSPRQSEPEFRLMGTCPTEHDEMDFPVIGVREPDRDVVENDAQSQPSVDMVFVTVPAGYYPIGNDRQEEPQPWKRESGKWMAQFTHSFEIGKYEVTNRQYKARHPSHRRDDDRPVVTLSWDEAKRFCESLGSSVRLPTEAEWEAAARGTDGRMYPWGNETPEGRSVVWKAERTADVTRRTDDVGPFGTVHQAGNVVEWTLDCFSPTTYQIYHENPALRVDPKPHEPATCARRVVRGGAFNQEDPWYLRTTYRFSFPPSSQLGGLGFRCVRDSSVP